MWQNPQKSLMETSFFVQCFKSFKEKEPGICPWRTFLFCVVDEIFIEVL